MAEGWALKIEGCFYAVFEPTDMRRRSEAKHCSSLCSQSEGDDIATAKHCNSNKVMAQSAGHVRYVFVALTLRAK